MVEETWGQKIQREAKEHGLAAIKKAIKDVKDRGISLGAEEVVWVTNDNAELGVRIGDQCFFLYKGRSLIYEDGLHDDGSPMHVRPVFKREFGECAHPLNRIREGLIGTVSLDDSDEWEEMPKQHK